MTLHKKVRLTLTLIITLSAYILCVCSLFQTNAFVIPLISFIVLFISLYFLAIDIYHFRYLWVGILLTFFTIAELFVFGGDTRHSYLEILLFNSAIGLLLFFLVKQLKNRIRFRAFTYFTEGGYAIVAILTLFFSVLMLGKYSQIPFTCDDLDQVSNQLIGSQFFKSLVPEKAPLNLPQSSQKSEVELRFENTRSIVMTQAVELQDSISKNSCEFLMGKLRTTQINEGFQLAIILLMYFILVGVFKILLWLISILGFFVFVLLKPLKIYTYEKGHIEKEWIK
ncbi:MAG: DUF63 family protein [Candidatus Peribacteria bacterium]|jgi:hypothetical protein|nr:DUF63 family protein [Candidatus Peribacteria bacterium]